MVILIILAALLPAVLLWLYIWKKDPQKEEILHLSQNIGQYINDNLLIKNNNYYQ